jgi:futalosine hydrolase
MNTDKGKTLICVSTALEGALLRDHARAVVTGVGAVNAAYALTREIERDRPERIIVCGIGGANPASGLKIGDVVCAESECYGDLGASSPEGFLDMRALGFPVIAFEPPIYNTLSMQIFPTELRVPFVTRNTCTGADVITGILGAAVENMEGAAVAHVAALAGIPVGEIRGVSNMVGPRDKSTWRVKEAATAAQEALLQWIKRRA